MTTENYPPISPGTHVRTTEPNLEKRREWTDEGWASKKWDVRGTILTHHDSHGLCYDVRHEDGTEGCYDPSEFEVTMTLSSVIDELREDAIQREELSKHGSPVSSIAEDVTEGQIAAVMHSILKKLEQVTSL